MFLMLKILILNETEVSTLCYRSFIFVVFADNLLFTWLTDHIYVELTGFTYVSNSKYDFNWPLQAKTLSLWTSNPQQIGCTTKIILLLLFLS